MATVASDMEYEGLTKLESTQMMMGPAITTTTFIKGPIEEGRKVLKGRLLLVLQANPWLCGTLIKKGCCGKVVQLNYPASVKEGDVEVEKCFLDDGNKGGLGNGLTRRGTFGVFVEGCGGGRDGVDGASDADTREARNAAKHLP